MTERPLRITRRQYLLLTLITSALPFLYWILQGRGFYQMGFDFNDQIIPFGVDMVRTWKTGGFDPVSFSLDLGLPTLLSYSYYGMFSPFFLPALLFPATAFPYVAGFLYILKYLVSCHTAYFYLRKFTKQESSAMIASLFYAFSGFSAAAIEFYFFQDVVALFPLLLLALENLTETDARSSWACILFSLAVFLNCITNYFFFVQEVIFLIVYFFFRNAHRKRQVLPLMMRCLFYGVLGTGLAAFAFLPNIIAILANSRVTDATRTPQGFLHDVPNTLLVIKGFLLPGEAYNEMSAILEEEYFIGSVFLPGGALALVIAYLWKQRTWLKRLLVLLIVMSFSPMLSSVFLLFITPYYRWWYMLALMMALAAALVLDEPEQYPVRRSAVAYIALIVLLLAAIFLLRDADGGSYVFFRNRLLLYTAVAIAGAAAVLLRCRRSILVVTLVAAVFTTHWVQYTYRRADEETPAPLYESRYRIAMTLHTEDPAHRFQNHATVLMLPSEEGVSGTNTYITTASAGLREFDALFGFHDPNGRFRMNKNEVPGLLAALGARYYAYSEAIYPEKRTEEDLRTGQILEEYEVDGHTVQLLAFPASPIAYTTKNYISREEMEKLPVEFRGIALLEAVLIEDSDIRKLPENVRQITAEEITERILQDEAHTEGEALFTNRVIAELAAENEQNSLQGFRRGYHGMTGKTTNTEDAILYCSVPVDKGWTLSIDGKEQEILSSSGLMAAIIPAGAHDISFTYRTPWLYPGIGISTLATMLLSIMAWNGMRRHSVVR